MSTAATLISYAENITSIDKDTIGVPGLEDTQLLSIANQANLEYYNAHIQGGGEPPISFQEEVAYETVNDTDLAENVATTDTEFNIDDSSNLDASSGAIIVWDDQVPDVIYYTTAAANNLAGVTNISFAHETDDPVQKLYKLPTDFDSFRSQEDSPEGVLVEGTPFFFSSSAKPEGNQFGLLDNGTNKFLQFPRGMGSSTVYIRYNKAPTTIDELTDNVDVPVHDEYFIVYRLTEHMESVIGLNADQVNRSRALADEILLRSLKRRNIGKRIKIGSRFPNRSLPYPIPVNDLRNG